MIATLTEYDWQHEAARQEAYRKVHYLMNGCEYWFQGSFDAMPGNLALETAQWLEDEYYEILRKL